MAASPSPLDNKLLAALAESTRTAGSTTSCCGIAAWQVLYAVGRCPDACLLSDDGDRLLLYVMTNGASAEIAVVGNEGVVGISLFMGGESTPSRPSCKAAASGFRCRASASRKSSRARRSSFAAALFRYTQAA
jgi:hypothetical protein